MPPDVRGDEHPPLRHRLQRLERCHELREAHAAARVHEQVDEVVVALHVMVRDAPGKDDAFVEPARSDQAPQRLVLRPSSDQQHSQLRMARRESGRGLDQQVETLVGIERAGKADHRRTLESELRPQRRVGRATRREREGIDRVGNDGHPARRDAAGDDFGSQSLADRRHVVRAAERKGLEGTRKAIAEAPLAHRAVVDGGVLPRRPQFVHDRQAALAADPKRRQHVEHRRMCVQHVRPELRGELVDASGRGSHFAEVAETRQPRRAPRDGCPVEAPAVHDLAARGADILARRRELQGLPAERTLLAQDGDGPEHVPAVQRKRVIENVQNSHRTLALNVQDVVIPANAGIQ